MYLQGAEQVVSAARTIASAAETMSQNCRWFGEVLDRDLTQRREMAELAHQHDLDALVQVGVYVARLEAAMGHPLVVLERASTREEELRVRDDKWRGVRDLVDDQATDEGLWFVATTAPEGHLQAALRKLHALIEATART